MTTTKIKLAVLALIAVALAIVAGTVLFGDQRNSKQDAEEISAQRAPSVDADASQVRDPTLASASNKTTDDSEIVSGSLAHRFDRERNLASLLTEAEAGAESGNVEAMAVKARIYEECMNQVADPDFVDAQVRSALAAKPNNEAFLRKAAEISKERCSGVLAVTSLEQVLAAYRSAAEAGSLSARLRSLNIEGGFETIPDEELGQMIGSAIRNGDATAVAELGNLLGVRSSGRSLEAFGGMYGSHIEGIAWEVAACRLGANCGPTSTRLNQMCLVNGACGYGSIEQMYQMAGVSLSDWQRVQAALDRILNFNG